MEAVGACSITRFNNSRVVGSVQCKSSMMKRTGCRSASSRRRATRVSSVFCRWRCGDRLSSAYRDSGSDNESSGAKSGTDSSKGSRYWLRACSSFATFASGASWASNRKSRWSRSTKGNRAVFCEYSALRHSQRTCGSLATWSFSTCTSRDFPMPASPVSKTTCPCPALTCSHRSRSSVTSDSRPTSGVSPRVTATSRRPLALLS